MPPTEGLPIRAQMVHATPMTRFGKILWLGDAMPDLLPRREGNPPIPLVTKDRQAGKAASTSDETPDLDESSHPSET